MKGIGCLFGTHIGFSSRVLSYVGPGVFPEHQELSALVIGSNYGPEFFLVKSQRTPGPGHTFGLLLVLDKVLILDKGSSRRTASHTSTLCHYLCLACGFISNDFAR